MPERYGSERAQRPDVSRRRALVVAVFLCAWMLVVGAKLAYLQTSQHEWLTKRARAQQLNVERLAPTRGLILDRKGRELARSVDTDSFFAAPGELENADEAARALARVLGLDADALSTRLRQAKESRRSFVWLARKVSEEQARAVRELKLKGIYSMQEPQRRYPNGGLAAHVLGFVDLDEKGLGGVEQVFNASLSGEEGRLVVGRDARRGIFESAGDAARPGQSLVLTIDQTVQYRAEQVLAAAVERARAKSGAAIVLDPKTGEILALANAPSFDPNAASGTSAEMLRNESLQNIYEPGSTFKVVAFSAALEEGLTRPDEKIDCLGGGINVLGRFVRDHTPYGTLTATEALAKSSNVAAIKLGMRVGNERMYDYMRRFGFGARTGVELTGETAGLLRKVEKWHPSSIGSLAIGQEIGVTPLQMAAAFGVLANDGVRVAPHLVREVRDAEGQAVRRAQPEARRVISAETAQTIRRMLETVTLKGTAKRAQLEGYTAAGKTGTAQKIDPKTRAYSKTKHVASFVGFAPVENPSVVIVVVVDEPVGAYHGGDVAAPIFRELADQILPYLGVMPDEEIETPPASTPGLLAAAPRVAEGEGGASKDVEGDAQQPSNLPVVTKGEGLAPGGEISEVVYASAGGRSLLMPDLRGRSVRDVAMVCAQLGLELEAYGEGRAVRQSPAVGTPLAAGQRVRIEFGRSD
ncbi:MAG TPA: penicillin-binding protein [Pyrinomonadaceae bacterium]|nr:penicillin-binding protein [Pyrinomonadaceae bacterium]